jgi:anti-anti-sigma factor
VHQEDRVKLSIEQLPNGKREVRLVLRGDIDYETAQHLRASVSSALDAKVDSIVVDLAGVTFLDSTGIGTLVVARRICHDLGVVLRVQQTSPFIARLFAVVGVADVLGVPEPAGVVASELPRPRTTGAAQPVS